MLKRLEILADNSVAEQFHCLAEHGFSAYVETSGGKLLYDTGRGDVIIRNAEALGVDLRALDAVVLSHGHYDHTGGLEQVLKLTGPIDVYAHPSVFDKKWLVTKLGKRDIGFPSTKGKLERLGARFHFSTGPTRVVEDTWVTGQIPRARGFEPTDSELLTRTHRGLVIDWVFDDQAMFVVDEDGINVVVGCTHSGVGNTIKHVNRIANGAPVKLLVGGLHLFKAGAPAIKQTIRRLAHFEVQRVAVSHCTGSRASALIQAAFGAGFRSAAVGAKLL